MRHSVELMSEKLKAKAVKLLHRAYIYADQYVREHGPLHELIWIEYENGDLIIYVPFENQSLTDFVKKQIGINNKPQ